VVIPAFRLGRSVNQVVGLSAGIVIDVEYAETVTVEAGACVENSTGVSVGSGAAA
jgi:hypothetical protein